MANINNFGPKTQQLDELNNEIIDAYNADKK